MSSTHKVMVLAPDPQTAEQRIKDVQWGPGIRIIWVGNFIRHQVVGISTSAIEQVYEADMVWSSGFEDDAEDEPEEEEEVKARPAIAYANVTEDDWVMADESEDEEVTP